MRSIRFSVLAAGAFAACLALSGCANTWGDYARAEGVPGCSTSGRDACACVEPCASPCPDRPPAAHPGEAWCRVKIPAVYETRCETITVECETCRCEWVPPVYETRVREVCVKPPCAKEIHVPAVSRTIEECVEICPARVELQRVCCPVNPCPDPCAPRQEECFAEVQIPAQTKRMCREVCVTPAATKTVYEPALYETVVENCVVKPGYWRTVPAPAVHDRVCHQVCVQPERWEWRRNDACVVPAPCVPPSPCVPPAMAPVVRPPSMPAPVVFPPPPSPAVVPAPAPADFDGDSAPPPPDDAEAPEAPEPSTPE
jgi:hypothetical protein